MREILFRGKRIDNGEWVDGWLTHRYRYDQQYKKEILGPVIDYPHKLTLGETSGTSICSAKVDPSTVGQYTGQTDKNCELIFEGDIVKTIKYGKDDGTGRNFAGADCFCVEFSDGGYHLVNKWRRFNLRPDVDMERIGNIHDNPELLEGGGTT